MWMKRYTAKLMNPYDESYMRHSYWYERVWMWFARRKAWLMVWIERRGIIHDRKL